MLDICQHGEKADQSNKSKCEHHILPTQIRNAPTARFGRFVFTVCPVAESEEYRSKRQRGLVHRGLMLCSSTAVSPSGSNV